MLDDPNVAQSCNLTREYTHKEIEMIETRAYQRGLADGRAERDAEWAKALDTCGIVEAYKSQRQEIVIPSRCISRLRETGPNANLSPTQSHEAYNN